MNSNPDYSEWTREQKEEYAKERMLLMKSKNAKLMQRHAEVERDRIEAEEHNSAITGIPKVISKKEKNDYILDSNEAEKKTQYTREWDRGKSDKEYWEPPEYHSSFENYKSSHFDRNDNVHNYPRTENKQGGAAEGFKNRSGRENYNYKRYDHSQYKNTSRSYYQSSPPKTGREKGYQKESRWKSQKTYPEERYRKDDYKRSNPIRSLNKTWPHSCTSDSDSGNLSNAMTPDKTSLWHDDKLTEDQNKHNVTQKWVASMNKSNNLNQAVIPPPKIVVPEKSYSKFDRFERSSNNSADDDDDDDDAFSLKNKFDVRSKQMYHKFWKKESIHKSFPDTNEREYMMKQDKYSFQGHLSGYNKNENFRKQRFQNKGSKNDFKEGFTGNKFKEPKSMTDDSWNNSELPKDIKLGRSSDSNYHKSAACDVDDGLWGNAEQSIKWKLSDDESQGYEQTKKIVKPKEEYRKKVCSDKFIQRSKMAKPSNEKYQEYSDGGWSTVSEEGEIVDTEVRGRKKKRP